MQHLCLVISMYSTCVLINNVYVYMYMCCVLQHLYIHVHVCVLHVVLTMYTCTCTCVCLTASVYTCTCMCFTCCVNNVYMYMYMCVFECTCITASATQSALEQTCSTLHSDNTSLNQQLEEVGAELARHREMETGLRAMQASLQSRTYCTSRDVPWIIVVLVNPGIL